ncbi:hypothetical protein POM88_020143 [Heracleum sosnowskyi]|uniref:Transposase-associated domain-containing protein n=1 Tax=Heracleum sosnowskyi TaxID=360622 RepID=A0AAD8H2P8_9APIA|nr:hypothetical protein POM88_043076 [Heracleum sosnowskyi]KAK1382408.1 hypothetical protein POM88_020143 [Heracleum sosnowskyi]
MDKSWMNADRRTKEFQRGVDGLLMFALENGQDGNKISCPCLKCAHSKSWKARIVRGHLFQNGIDQSYTCWIWHGEVSTGESQHAAEDTSSSSQSVDQNPMKTENAGDTDDNADDNTTAVIPFFNEHMAFLMTKYPEHENDEMWLKNKQNETFPKWFKEKIASDLEDKKELSNEIIWIADEPNKDVPTFSGYRMDGVTFRTRERDDMRQLPEKNYYEDNVYENEASVEVELENDFYMPNFPDVDEEDMPTSYIRDDVDELIQLS